LNVVRHGAELNLRSGLRWLRGERNPRQRNTNHACPAQAPQHELSDPAESSKRRRANPQPARDHHSAPDPLPQMHAKQLKLPDKDSKRLPQTQNWQALEIMHCRMSDRALQGALHFWTVLDVGDGPIDADLVMIRAAK
jgi:hypothetical protein